MSIDRPFVFVNTAMTADGKIDTVARKGAPVSSAGDWERVDRLRAECDAVMVGGQTLLGEDPRLTVKSPALRALRAERGLEENPMKVGIVSRIVPEEEGPTIRGDGKFMTAGPARIVIFTGGETDPAQITRLRDRGADVIVAGEWRVDLVQALRLLHGMGVKRLMVEGGGTLNSELFRLGLVDELHLYIAPLIFGGASAPTVADGAGLSRTEAVQLELRGVEQTAEGGLIVQYAVIH